MTPARATQASPRRTKPQSPEAELAIARLEQMSTDLRGCALVDAAGECLAASGDADRWGAAANAFLAAADDADEGEVSSVHVATEDGEAFAVRDGELALVAVAERYALASLMLFDMRTILRDLRTGAGLPDHRKPHPSELAGSEDGSE
jgi:hypothetical protein